MTTTNPPVVEPSLRAHPDPGRSGPRPRRRPPGEDHPLLVWGLRLIGLVVLAVAWQVWAGQQRSLLLPDFLSTMQAVLNLMVRGTIWEPLFLSNQAMVLGFALAAVTAVPVGLLMARARAIESFVDVYLNILMVTPMAALIPLFMMALGLDLWARAAVVFVFAAPVMTVNTRAGVRTIDPSLVDMAHTFGASELQVWRRVLLPGALPAMLTGIRLGLSRAVNGMLLAELLLMAVGIGRLILDFRGHFDAASLFGVVLILLLESVVLLLFAQWLEKRLAPWAIAGGSR